MLPIIPASMLQISKDQWYSEINTMTAGAHGSLEDMSYNPVASSCMLSRLSRKEQGILESATTICYPPFVDRFSPAYLHPLSLGHYISMDVTLKLCMKLMGQASYRAPKHVREEAPFGDEVARRRLLTVRGRKGAVLIMHPLQSEASEQIVTH